MSNWNKIFKPIVVLCVICVVITGALAATNSATAPIILAAKLEAERLARMELLPEADDFTRVDSVSVENVTDVYTANNGAGCVITSTAKGYGGDLQVMAGIDKNGKIAGVKLMDNNETQGIGSKTCEDSYTSQYKGKDSTLDGVTAISGATVTSNGVTRGVNNALKAAEAYQKGGLS